MSLIIGLGSNQGECLQHLRKAQENLEQVFKLIKASRVYESKAIEYTDQANFFNQVLEFSPPNENPDSLMRILLGIEEKLGRVRHLPKGPRTIDLDLLFLGVESYKSPLVEIPHPAWFKRSFVVTPLRELPFAGQLERHFPFPSGFDNSCWPVS